MLLMMVVSIRMMLKMMIVTRTMTMSVTMTIMMMMTIISMAMMKLLMIKMTEFAIDSEELQGVDIDLGFGFKVQHAKLLGMEKLRFMDFEGFEA